MYSGPLELPGLAKMGPKRAMVAPTRVLMNVNRSYED